ALGEAAASAFAGAPQAAGVAGAESGAEFSSGFRVAATAGAGETRAALTGELRGIQTPTQFVHIAPDLTGFAAAVQAEASAALASIRLPAGLGLAGALAGESSVLACAGGRSRKRPLGGCGGGGL